MMKSRRVCPTTVEQLKRDTWEHLVPRSPTPGWVIIQDARRRAGQVFRVPPVCLGVPK